MNSWIDFFYFFIIGVTLLLSIMGLWFTAIMPGIDRWGRRFFKGYFFVHLLTGLSCLTGMILYYSSAPGAVQKPMLVLESLLLALPLPMLTAYLLHCCEENLRKSRLFRAALVLWEVYFALNLSSLFTEAFFYILPDGSYSRGSWFPLLLLPMAATVLLDLSGLIQRRKRLSRKEFLSFLIAFLPLTGVLLVHLFVDIVPLVDICYVLSAHSMYSLILSDQIEQDLRRQREIAEQQREIANWQREYAEQQKEIAEQQRENAEQQREIAEQQREIARQQREIANQRASILVLQMRPHFIYNTLTSIYCLCSQEFIGKDTKVERYEGGLMIPGMAEGHCHCSVGGTVELFEAKLWKIFSVEEMLARVKELIEKHPEYEVYQGMGFLPIGEFYGPNGPTADMLDGLSDKPIVLADGGLHSYWVNHAAMERLGINKDTPDVSDGIVVRDADGNPTGWFREGAMAYIKPLVVFTVEQYEEGFLRYQEEYLAHGTTIFMDVIINWDYTDNEVEALHQLDAEGKLKMHAYGAYQVFQAAGHDTIAEVEHAAALRERTKGPMFDLINTKVQLDGTISASHSTAYMKEPYCDPESGKTQHRGQLRMDMDTLTAVYRRSHELGMPVHLHAIGDGALSMALDAMEKANAQTGPHDFRDAIAHLEVVDRADIPRMAKLGVVASTDPFWFPGGAEVLAIMTYALGKERAGAMHPMKSFFDAGVVASSVSDYPITYPAYPLTSIYNGVTRQHPGQPETAHCPAERVTVEQMIQAVTLNAACQFLCDDRLGSISVGKEADMVLLERDITACDPEQIVDTPVLRTMVGGEWVYARA